MFRRLVLAGVLVAVVAGVGVAVQPAAATPQQADENGTAFGASIGDAAVADEATRLNVTGVDSGTPVEIAVNGLAPAELAGKIDGEQTAAGVRTTVPANGSIPVAAPPACTAGEFTLQVQRLDTGERTTTEYVVTRELVADAEFERGSVSGRPGTVVPVTVESECHDVTLRIADPDSPYEASVTVADDGDRNHTVWIDTSEPMNASALFAAEADATVTDRRRYGVHTDLNGTYRLVAAYSNETLDTANLTVSPDGTPRPSAEDGMISAESVSDLFVTNDPDEDAKIPLAIDQVNREVPVTAHLRDATAGVPRATFAAMVSNDTAREDPRVHRFENGTVRLSLPAEMRCRTGELTVAFQRLDTGATATAETTAFVYDSLRGSLHERNYTVESGSILPVTITRECHDLTLELSRTDSNATASIELGTGDAVKRNETLWFDTERAGSATELARSAVGTPIRNVTTTFSDGALPPGTYSLGTVYNGHEIGSATLTVTNDSAAGTPPDSTDGSSGTTTSTPNTVVPPPTEPSTTEHTTADRTATDATPSDRTAEGNAMRPAGTDSFGTTTRATDTDGSGPGFGPVLTASSLAVLAVLAARRNGH